MGTEINFVAVKRALQQSWCQRSLAYGLCVLDTWRLNYWGPDLTPEANTEDTDGYPARINSLSHSLVALVSRSISINYSSVPPTWNFQDLKVTLSISGFMQLTSGEMISTINNSSHLTYHKLIIIHLRERPRSSVVVKALCYKPEGRGFDTRWGNFLNLPNPSGRTSRWGLLSLWHKWVPET
jgi:hypothetical protein